VHRNETNACVIMDLWALGFRATKRKITWFKPAQFKFMRPS
jgi:hypothetical protein